jgi:predicted transcriptional regulator
MADMPWVPPQVEALAPREREIATIIYAHGATTAREMEDLLERRISNSAIRTMLMRMVRKGILRRAGGRKGRGQACIYVPLITPEKVKRKALEHLASLYFAGSLATMTVELFEGLDTLEDIERVRAQIGGGKRAGPDANLELAA